MTFDEGRLRDLIGIIERHPTTFTWGGAEYKCMTARIALEVPLVPGGFEERPVFDFMTTIVDKDSQGALVSRFPDDTPPDANEVVQIHDVDYRLKDIEKDIWDEDRDRHLVMRATLWSAEVSG